MESRCDVSLSSISRSISSCRAHCSSGVPLRNTFHMRGSMLFAYSAWACWTAALVSSSPSTSAILAILLPEKDSNLVSELPTHWFANQTKRISIRTLAQYFTSWISSCFVATKPGISTAPAPLTSSTEPTVHSPNAVSYLENPKALLSGLSLVSFVMLPLLLQLVQHCGHLLQP